MAGEHINSSLKQNSKMLISKLEKGVNELKYLVGKDSGKNSQILKNRKYTSTPKLHIKRIIETSEKTPNNYYCDDGCTATSICDAATSVLLLHKGNARIKKKKKSPEKHLKNNYKPKDIEQKSKKVCYSPKLNRKSLVTRSCEPEKTMMGYDWIAGMLDNDSYIDKKPERFFNDIEEFRRVNREACKSKQGDENLSEEKTALKSFGKEEKENQPLCCNGDGVYRVNNRLHLIPIHGPYSSCPMCKRSNLKSDEKEGYARVSIPHSAISSHFQARAHRRKSYDPSNSVALSMHCLAGWENSKPSYAPGPLSIDLASHTRTDGMTSLKPMKRPR